MLLSTVDFDYHRDDKTVVVEKASSPTMADILAADGTEKLQIAQILDWDKTCFRDKAELVNNEEIVGRMQQDVIQHDKDDDADDSHKAAVGGQENTSDDVGVPCTASGGEEDLLGYFDLGLCSSRRWSI